jgi:hypothetical protein
LVCGEFGILQIIGFNLDSILGCLDPLFELGLDFLRQVIINLLILLGLSLKLCDIDAQLFSLRCGLDLHAFGLGGLHHLCQQLFLSSQDLLHLQNFLSLFLILLVDCGT